MDYEIQDVAEARYAVIRSTVPYEEIPGTIRDGLDRVLAWLGDEHGPPLCFSSRVGDGQLSVAPGWTVTGDPGEPPAPIELVTTAAAPSVVYVHVGPYDELPGIYQQLWAALEAEGRTPTGEPREIYESGPEAPTPTTRIVWPL